MEKDLENGIIFLHLFTIFQIYPIVHFTKLMVIGGDSEKHVVEVIDLSVEGLTCTQPPNYPVGLGLVGAYFDGHAMGCGGLGPTSRCYTFDVQVNEDKGNLQLIKSIPLA